MFFAVLVVVIALAPLFAAGKSRSYAAANEDIPMGFDLEVGFTTITLTQVNDYLKDGADAMDATYSTADKGLELGGFVGFEIAENFQLGPKIEMIYVLPAGYSKSDNSVNYSAILFPIMGYAKYMFPLKNSDLKLGITGGLGLTVAKGFIAYDVLNVSESSSVTGSGFTFEIAGALKMNSGLYFNLGYRICTIPQMTLDPEFMGSDAGDTAEDWDGDTMSYDWGGLLINIDYSF